jgi:hypothetical protein
MLNLYGHNPTLKDLNLKSILEKMLMIKYKSNKLKSLSLYKFILSAQIARKTLLLMIGIQSFKLDRWLTIKERFYH